MTRINRTSETDSPTYEVLAQTVLLAAVRENDGLPCGGELEERRGVVANQ